MKATCSINKSINSPQRFVIDTWTTAPFDTLLERKTHNWQVRQSNRALEPNTMMKKMKQRMRNDKHLVFSLSIMRSMTVPLSSTMDLSKTSVRNLELAQLVRLFNYILFTIDKSVNLPNMKFFMEIRWSQFLVFIHKMIYEREKIEHKIINK